MQEGFRQTEGIVSEFKHLVFTSSHLVGNLRCPAILVNQRWIDELEVAFAGSGGRWVAISFSAQFLFISLHPPHSKFSLDEFMEPMDELKSFLLNRRERNIVIGVDANVGVSSVVDFCHVGASVPDSRQDHKDLRAH